MRVVDRGLVDTLIVWVESETRKDLALSFQDVAGCSEIWNMVTRIKQNYALDAGIVSLALCSLVRCVLTAFRRIVDAIRPADR